MQSKPLFRHFASSLNALSNCIARNNGEWEIKHESNLIYLAKEFMPSGSGVDNGTKIDIDACLKNPKRLVFTCGFHHMNDCGFYYGWTEHQIIVTASLQFEFDLRITGRDRNQIKEHLHEIFSHALTRSVVQTVDGFEFAKE